MSNTIKQLLLFKVIVLAVPMLNSYSPAQVDSGSTSDTHLDWKPLPDLPDELGVAGPFVGVHGDALIVAGGANFSRPVWENEKRWQNRVHVLTTKNDEYAWVEGGRLSQPTAYGASVSTPYGVVCAGGNNENEILREVFLLTWDVKARKVSRVRYPSLPKPCAYGQAAVIGDVIYLAGGQSGSGLDSSMKNLWALDLSNRDKPEEFAWRELVPWPAEPRAFNLTVQQHNGHDDCIYVISGRQQSGDDVLFLTDVWEYTPRVAKWRRRADVPRCVMAGTGFGFGQNRIYVLGGADGSLFHAADNLKDQHPGFPKEAFVYDTIANSWVSAGPTPSNHVTTNPVIWHDRMIVASGEVRPRVRSSGVWSVRPDRRLFHEHE